MRLPSRKTTSSNRPVRSLIPRERSQEATTRIKLCTEQDATMFNDPAHVRKWMATSPPPLIEQTTFDEAYSGLHGPPPGRFQLDGSRVSHHNLLSGPEYPGIEPSSNWQTHSGSFSSGEGNKPIHTFRYDVPGSVDMACTRSNQSVAFTSDYSISSGIACTIGPFSQASYSVPTARSSPASAPMDPIFTASCPTPSFLSRSMTSPQVIGTSEGYMPGFPNYDDILPGPMMNTTQVQSPTNLYPVDLLHDQTIRMPQNHGRGALEYNPFWPPSEPGAEILAVPTTSSVYNAQDRATKQMSSNTNPRDHYLYHVEANAFDNLYYCPFGPTEGCPHRPEKLKCNYDKHLDSHLKPYRCKLTACSSVPFSSTACLLRHEREAHGMHGHGTNPYMCRYPDCDRGRGFPRRYNLEDHMRRMHGYEPIPNTRRRSATEGNAIRPAVVRSAKRRSTTTSGPPPSFDPANFRISKVSSTRGSAALRRKSIQ